MIVNILLVCYVVSVFPRFSLFLIVLFFLLPLPFLTLFSEFNLPKRKKAQGQKWNYLHSRLRVKGKELSLLFCWICQPSAKHPCGRNHRRHRKQG